MKFVGTAQTDLFRLGERSLFEVALHGFDLILGSTLLFRRNRVRGDSIIAILKPGDAGCNQFFVGAGQRAISHERLEERGNTLRQRRSMRNGFEHVGHYAPLLKESVVNGADLGGDLVAL